MFYNILFYLFFFTNIQPNLFWNLRLASDINSAAEVVDKVDIEKQYSKPGL